MMNTGPYRTPEPRTDDETVLAPKPKWEMNESFCMVFLMVGLLLSEVLICWFDGPIK